MDAIEKENPILGRAAQGVCAAEPSTLPAFADCRHFVGNIALGDAKARSRDALGQTWHNIN